MKTIKAVIQNPEEYEQAILNGEQISIEVVTPEKKPKKIELQGGEWALQPTGTANLFGAPSSTEYIQAGVERQTEQQAQIAAKGMLRRNRLSALAEQLGTGEKEFVKDDNNYYIYFDNTKWDWSKSYHSNRPDCVYMDLETADAVCDALNDGLFDLDGE